MTNISSVKNFLVIGSGGREHAIVKKLKQSNMAGQIYAYPANAGILQDAQATYIANDSFEEIAQFCANEKIDIVIVGPEQPLVDGIVDFLEERGIKAFGPDKTASQMEGSKQFMKDFCHRHKIPTAEYATFDNPSEAKDHVRLKGSPIVVKADGLAAGKGVTVALTEEQALKAIDEAFSGKFGEAGHKVVIEEFLEGEELSYFIISDGKTIIPLGSAQDHKRAFDGDEGSNTGGMGTYSPAPISTNEVEKRILNNIIKPTIKGLADDGYNYKGFLFAGIMLSKTGEPKLIEYNIRFGDPEAQVILPRIDFDFAEIIDKAVNQDLASLGEIKLKDTHALCVVMAANGYPDTYEKNHRINLNSVEEEFNKNGLEQLVIYHAGTKINNAQQLVSNGGRVLGVTGFGKNLVEAKNNAYNAISKIDFKNGFYRRDIGWRALSQKKA